MSRYVYRPLYLSTILALGITLGSGHRDHVSYATYIGGSESNTIIGADFGPNGRLYVVGHTTNPDFPGIVPQGQPGGSSDIFAARIDPASGSYEWLTLAGGPGIDLASDFKISPDGNLYITGTTLESGFPEINPSQPGFGGGNRDGVALIIGPDGDLLFSTNIGGSGDDRAQSLDIGPAGEFVMGGYTDSDDFPVMNALQPNNAGPGEDDAFIQIVDLVTNSVVFSTYLGGSDRDRLRTVTVDGTGNVWLAGSTQSTDFPLEGAFDSEITGSSSSDGFISMVSHAVSGPGATPQLGFSSFFGGSSFDGINDLSASASGRIFGVGSTGSPDIPLMQPQQSVYGGNTDGFFFVFGEDGALMASSYIGLESDREELNAVAATGEDCALAAGTSITLGTSEDRAEVHQVCADGSAEERDSHALGKPADIVVSPDGSAAMISGETVEGGINPTDGAVQSVPPTTDDLSNKNNGFVLIFILDVPPAPILQVRKTPSTDSLEVFESFTWTIEVTNVGTAAAENVKVRDIVVSVDVRLSGLGTGTETLNIPGEFEWSIGDLGPSETWSHTLSAVVTSIPTRQGFVGFVNKLYASAENAAVDSTRSEVQVTLNPTDIFMFWLGGQRAGKKAIGAFDAYLDDVLIMDDVQDATAILSELTGVRSGTPMLDIVDSNDPDNSNPIVSLPVNLLQEGDTTLTGGTAIVLFEVGDDSVGFLQNNAFDTSSSDGQVRISVVNLSTTSIDVHAGFNRDQLIADNLSEEDFSAFVDIEPGDVVLSAEPSGGTDPPKYFRFELSALSGETALVSFTEDSGGSVSMQLASSDGQIVDGHVVTSRDRDVALPQRVSITGIHPNPASTTATLHMDLPSEASVEMRVFDVVGRTVLPPSVRTLEAGFDRRIDVNTAGLAAGIYLYRMTIVQSEASSVRSGMFVVAR